MKKWRESQTVSVQFHGEWTQIKNRKSDAIPTMWMSGTHAGRRCARECTRRRAEGRRRGRYYPRDATSADGIEESTDSGRADDPRNLKAFPRGVRRLDKAHVSSLERSQGLMVGSQKHE